MKKWQKIYISISVIVFIILISLVYLFIKLQGNMSEQNALFWHNTLQWFSILYMGCLMVFFAICLFSVIKGGVHNITKCDDELFMQIDNYKKCWEEDDSYFIRQIQIINLYYKEKVGKIKDSKEIKRLYARASFLEIQDSLFGDFMTAFCSIALSLLASIIVQTTESEGGLSVFAYIVVVVALFFGVIMWKYYEKGQAGLYSYRVNLYERKLLNEMIEDLERSLVISADDERELQTQQTAIEELIKVRQGRKIKKQQKKVEDDIRRISRLNLCLGDYTNYYQQKIFINGHEAYLNYRKEEGKTNNYMGEANLANENYVSFLNILMDYDLISYIM